MPAGHGGCCRCSRRRRGDVCIKCADATFPYLPISALGYEVLHNGDGRWNGVAILSRVGLTDESIELPGHPEARFAPPATPPSSSMWR